ncbi:hypothetical protein [Roseivirga pacifica]|uniref:hypothetical protein n=1 Tax=Roseivirga pacifica TaxID=1267423 RepID=UPI003BA9E326
MKLEAKKGEIAVKWANGQWTYYATKKGRKIESVQSYYAKLPNFRFGYIYEVKSLRNLSVKGNRIRKLFYFDKKGITKEG